MPTFRTELLRTGGNTMGMVVPDDVVEALGRGKRPPVVVTINGHSWRSSVAVMGGRFMVGVPSAERGPAGVEDGGTVDVSLALDAAPRDFEVPEDFASALAEAGQREAFDRLAPSHRKEHVRAINEAKAPETRARRIAKAVETIGAKAKG